VDAAGRRQVRRERCDACGRCAGECWSGAIGILGRRVTAREAAARLLRDAPFFRTSGGGVTISGGEPLLQPEFTRAVLEEARRAGVHAAVETAGFAGPGAAREVAAACDLVLFDLKHADPGAHRLWTGVDNAAILRNLEYLSTAGPELIVRVTVVPGFNADRASVDAIGRLLAGLPRRPRVELLPVHRLAAAKYRNLGLPFRGTAVRSPAPGLLRDVAGRLADFGLDVPPRRLPEAA
jgi:pyruvate formate lyase activating enzyme